MHVDKLYAHGQTLCVWTNLKACRCFDENLGVAKTLAKSLNITNPRNFCVSSGTRMVVRTINWDELYKNCPSPKDVDNLKFGNNEFQLIVNCANRHSIISLFRGKLYEINEQKRDVI